MFPDGERNDERRRTAPAVVELAVVALVAVVLAVVESLAAVEGDAFVTVAEGVEPEPQPASAAAAAPSISMRFMRAA
jgi:hypothetical protein